MTLVPDRNDSHIHIHSHTIRTCVPARHPELSLRIFLAASVITFLLLPIDSLLFPSFLLALLFDTLNTPYGQLSNRLTTPTPTPVNRLDLRYPRISFRHSYCAILPSPVYLLVAHCSIRLSPVPAAFPSIPHDKLYTCCHSYPVFESARPPACLPDATLFVSGGFHLPSQPFYPRFLLSSFSKTEPFYHRSPEYTTPVPAHQHGYRHKSHAHDKTTSGGRASTRSATPLQVSLV